MSAETEDINAFVIEQINNAQAVSLASEIVKVYRDSWLATYPNEEIGITEADIQTRFSDMDDLTKEWQDKILGSENRSTWVVKNRETKITGFCVARKGDDQNELEYIYLQPSLQGKGLGHQLITRALSWMGSSKPIFLVGASYNSNAIRFYERYGFRLSQESIQPKVLPNGKKIPTMKMVRKPDKIVL